MSVSAHDSDRLQLSRFQWPRFLSAKSMFGIAILGVLLSVLVIGNSSINLVLVVNLVVVVVTTEVLFRCIPVTIRQASERNTRRLDGSLSRRRFVAEQKALKKMRMDLAWIVLSVALLANLLLWMVHQFVIPLGLGLDAISVAHWDPEVWKESIREAGVESRFEAWQISRAWPSGQFSGAFSTWLWNYWPVLLAAGSVLVAAGVYCWYLAVLSQYSRKLESRSQRYRMRDLARRRYA